MNLLRSAPVRSAELRRRALFRALKYYAWPYLFALLIAAALAFLGRVFGIDAMFEAGLILALSVLYVFVLALPGLLIGVILADHALRKGWATISSSAALATLVGGVLAATYGTLFFGISAGIDFAPLGLLPGFIAGVVFGDGLCQPPQK